MAKKKMKLKKLLKSIQTFKADIIAFDKLLKGPSNSSINEQIRQKRSELTTTYASLEKYITRIGQNQRMCDGVWNIFYSPYDNAFSGDIPERVFPSINAVLHDTDYILGKLKAMVQQELDELMNSTKNQGGLILKTGLHIYISIERMNELKKIKSKDFDLTKLINYCEEINKNFYNECFFSVPTNVRAILDHVPPIFKCANFSEVSNNYSGSRSFKESMQHLERSSRKIADSFLHTQIRNKEILPNHTQIDFSNDLDVLLSEIYRLLK